MCKSDIQQLILYKSARLRSSFASRFRRRHHYGGGATEAAEAGVASGRDGHYQCGGGGELFVNFSNCRKLKNNFGFSAQVETYLASKYIKQFKNTLPPSEQPSKFTQLTCVADCPSTRYYVENNECKRCHRSCYDLGYETGWKVIGFRWVMKTWWRWKNIYLQMQRPLQRAGTAGLQEVQIRADRSSCWKLYPWSRGQVIPGLLFPVPAGIFWFSYSRPLQMPVQLAQGSRKHCLHEQRSSGPLCAIVYASRCGGGVCEWSLIVGPYWIEICHHSVGNRNS